MATTEDVATTTAWTSYSANDTITANTTGEPERPFILPWYFQVMYIVLFVSMVVVAAGGNCVVVWIVIAHKRMRSVTNYFLVNLAVADALISLLNTLFNFLYLIYQDWWFGDFHCKFSQFIATSTITASVFTFMAIAIDRYLGIVHPLRPRPRSRTILIIIALIWVASCIISLPNILYFKTETYPGGVTSCFIMWPDGQNSVSDLAYNILLLAVNYIVPLVALTVAYITVGIELWSSRAIGEATVRQEQIIRNKRKVVKMMIIVVVIFAICWFPMHLYFILVNRYPQIAEQSYIQHVYLIIYWFAMSNSMYNPFIYCWMNARFRQGFRYVFRFLPCVHYDSESFATGTVGHVQSIPMSVTDTTKIGHGHGNGSLLGAARPEQTETSYVPASRPRGARSLQP